MSTAHPTEEPYPCGVETGAEGVWTPRVVGWLTDIFCRWCERRTQHRTISELQELDDRTLKDIGLRRSDIVSAVHNGAFQRRIRRASI